MAVFTGYKNGTGEFRFNNISNNAWITFKTNFIDRLTIANTGNVGIGILSPQTKLAVNGNISSKKIIVTQSGWPDYVFDNSYKLPSLKEVEEYIKHYKHLPGVSSAREVEEKGLDLGDNQAQLLKKIEELTLYIIEMNKRLDDQQTEILILQKGK